MSSPALNQVLIVLLEAADAPVLHEVLGLLLGGADLVRQAEILRPVILELLEASPTALQAPEDVESRYSR